MPIRMPTFRFLVPLCAAVFASCDYLHQVRRSTVLPPEISPQEVQQAARSHRAVTQIHGWDGELFCVLVSEGDANAGVQCFGSALSVESGWFNRDPAPAVLQRSMELQAELIEILRLRFPELPPMDEWELEWHYLEVQQDRVVEPPEAARS
jgi:hypothetical protein